MSEANVHFTSLHLYDSFSQRLLQKQTKNLYDKLIKHNMVVKIKPKSNLLWTAILVGIKSHLNGSDVFI